MSEKCNLINVRVRRLHTSLMLFTDYSMLAGEGILIIKALHKA